MKACRNTFSVLFVPHTYWCCQNLSHSSSSIAVIRLSHMTYGLYYVKADSGNVDGTMDKLQQNILSALSRCLWSEKTFAWEHKQFVRCNYQGFRWKGFSSSLNVRGGKPVKFKHSLHFCQEWEGWLEVRCKSVNCGDCQQDVSPKHQVKSRWSWTFKVSVEMFF